MIEHIGTASTMQAKTIQSVKSSEGAKTREVMEKEPAVVQADESRKYDRFEHSGEVSYVAGSPDDPKAREAFDEKRNAAQTNNSRNFDRVEFSETYLSEDVSANAVGSVEEISSSQSVSDDSSESVDTDKLYQYTDTELKDFLLDGSITQREYDAEIAKRES
ncbi:MAG: hypothetical protein K2N38_05030 [Oscillospiraceae bacterium]|nr:hypothetical protein [Oscillospiraceae bacterium]